MRTMPNIFKFFIIFFVSYIILSLLPFAQPVRSVAVSTYNVFQQATFNAFHPTVRTDFRSFEGASTEYDYSVYIYSKPVWKAANNKKNAQPMFILNQNARLTAFGPFIMLFALIIASPISWKRKLLSIFIGAIFICVLLGMKFSAMIDQNAVDPATGAHLLRPDGMSIWLSLSSMFNNAFRTQEFLALLIIPIWAIASFRMKDWKWFMQ